MSDTIYIPTLPTIICSVDTAYNLQGILTPFGNFSQDLKLEVLSDDSQSSLDNLQFFLQDKIDEFHMITPCKCSIIHPSFEIDFTVQDARIKKRSHKPPLSFNKLLKSAKPAWYPQTVGAEYYGQPVFNSFIQLHNTQSLKQIKSLYPPRPMKYYDLLQNEGEIELRFDKFLPIPVFHQCLVQLQKAMKKTESNPLMIRCSYVYDGWSADGLYKVAGKDRFLFTWNDVELGFQQQNYSDLLPFLNIKDQHHLAGYYFELTPMIEEQDFRIERIKKDFGKSPELQ